MRKLLPLFLVLGTAMPVLAQVSVPTIIIQNEEKTEPLGLVELNYEVRILGYFAETTATMTFANPLGRNTEGDLYFPLPAGAAVSGYALDIQGAMVDGVSVDKQRATAIFEAEKNRRVDPGLVEWTKRDHFHTRVFPIPAGGRRTVRVQYVSELEDGKTGVTYRLPLEFERRIAKFSLRVEVVNPAAEPKIGEGGPANFHFAKWRNGFLAETKLEDALLEHALVVALPEVEKDRVQIEKADDGQVYFAIHDLPPAVPESRPPFRPTLVTIYWDASGSRAAVNHDREIACLRALLRQWSKLDPQPVYVDLRLLRNVLSPPQRFVLRDNELERLLGELNRIDYDGATQLGELTPIAGAAADCSLLFSDGVSTFGRAAPPPLAAPLYVFSAQAASDWPTLERLAAANAGRCFDLTQMTDAEVVAAITQPRYRPLAPKATAGRVSQLLSSAEDARQLSVVGRLESLQASVLLRYHSAEADDVQRTYAIDGSSAVGGSLLRRVWAQRKLSELLVDQQHNQEEIAALGKQFGVVTPYTSLMVLETLQQYLMYRVQPPDSSPAMKEAYLRQYPSGLRDSSVPKTVSEHEQRANKLTDVTRLWEQRLKWWAKDVRHFSPGSRAARQPTGGMGSMGMDSMRGGMGMGGMGGMGFGGMGGGPMPTGPAGTSPPASDHSSRPPDGGGQFSVGSFRHGLPAQIDFLPRDPHADYLKQLQEAPDSGAFAVYMRMRPRYALSPDFYVDCAGFFFDQRRTDVAIQILSNLAELQSADPFPLRLMAHRLARAGEYDLAIETFEDILARYPDEPHAYRDLGLLLAQRAEEARTALNPRKANSQPSSRNVLSIKARDKADIAADYARAMDLLGEVIARPWDNRFAEIEIPVLMEFNQIRMRANSFGVHQKLPDVRLCKMLDLDLRVVVTWYGADAGLQLVVTEPTGEKASMDHSPTQIGGLVSRTSAVDGPVEYLVRRAAKGEYQIQATFANAGPPRPVTVNVEIFTDFGRAREQRRQLTVSIDQKASTATLGSVKF